MERSLIFVTSSELSGGVGLNKCYACLAKEQTCIATTPPHQPRSIEKVKKVALVKLTHIIDVK